MYAGETFVAVLTMVLPLNVQMCQLIRDLIVSRIICFFVLLGRALRPTRPPLLLRTLWSLSVKTDWLQPTDFWPS